MKYRAVLFDLDGTLLDTLDDLTDSVNFAMDGMGWQRRERAEVRLFLGNGIRRLMELCSPKDISDDEFERAFALFKEHYDRHNQDKTKPYEGVLEVMAKLKEKGIKMAIVSNKVGSAVDMLYDKFFKNYADLAVGDMPGFKRKPAPDSCDYVIKKLGVDKSEVVYVGDSEVDLATAKNAGLDCITVLWGFRDEDFLREQGACVFAATPEDIVMEVCGL
ncbi:MAG: HAD family hydrolase [Lachnospiraceae bacterium]|nr:HAD family hydrolase [Lachnospiraceae bacterium]